MTKKLAITPKKTKILINKNKLKENN